MPDKRPFLTAEDVARDLDIDVIEAKRLIKELNERVVNLGGMCIYGRVSVSFYRKMKDTGFTSTEGRSEPERINEKRLLNVSEFCFYSGLGQNAAIKLGEKIGIVKRIARRRLFDRVLFDKWCDENNKAF